MTAQIIDGKGIAGRVRQAVAKRAEAFAQKHGRQPRLDVVILGDDPASQVYVRNKERAALRANIHGRVHRLPASTAQDEVLALLRDLNGTEHVDGILVQLPLPDGLDATAVLRCISPSKDVDGLHAQNAGQLFLGEPGLRPCTPLGCMRLLKEYGIELKGKHALVIGRSNLVGKPIAMMLLEEHATVSIAHSRTQDLPSLVGRADIVVAAVGRAKFIQGDWIKKGAAVLDVGINRQHDDALVGDVDYSAAKERAGWITPVPGGVGPMTIAMLLENTLHAAEAHRLAP